MRIHSTSEALYSSYQHTLRFLWIDEHLIFITLGFNLTSSPIIWLQITSSLSDQQYQLCLRKLGQQLTKFVPNKLGKALFTDNFHKKLKNLLPHNQFLLLEESIPDQLKGWRVRCRYRPCLTRVEVFYCVGNNLNRHSVSNHYTCVWQIYISSHKFLVSPVININSQIK